MDMVGNGLGRWKTMPIVRRTETGSMPGAYRSSSSSSTLPSMRVRGTTSCIRLRVRRNVDLPQPDGPMNAVTDFGSMPMLTSSIALTWPYQADRPTVSMRFAMVRSDLPRDEPVAAGEQAGAGVQD